MPYQSCLAAGDVAEGATVIVAIVGHARNHAERKGLCAPEDFREVDFDLGPPVAVRSHGLSVDENCRLVEDPLHDEHDVLACPTGGKFDLL